MARLRGAFFATRSSRMVRIVVGFHFVLPDLPIDGYQEYEMKRSPPRRACPSGPQSPLKFVLSVLRVRILLDSLFSASKLFMGCFSSSDIDFLSSVITCPRLRPKCRRQMSFPADSCRCCRPRQWLRSACAVRAGPTHLELKCPLACRPPAAPPAAVERRCCRPPLRPVDLPPATSRLVPATLPAPAVAPVGSPGC